MSLIKTECVMNIFSNHLMFVENATFLYFKIIVQMIHVPFHKPQLFDMND